MDKWQKKYKKAVKMIHELRDLFLDGFLDDGDFRKIIKELEE